MVAAEEIDADGVLDEDENFDDDSTNDYYEHGLQNSRGFRALKVWLGLRHCGRDGYIQLIRNDIARARELLGAQPPAIEAAVEAPSDPEEPNATNQPCPCCGGTMIVIEVFEAGSKPKYRPTTEGIDSS